MEFVERIARAIRPEFSQPKCQLISESGSADRDFADNHSVLFRLSDGFSLRFGKRILGMDYNDRWSAFLMRSETRQRFISTCNRVAGIIGSREGLLLPAGTILEDSFFDDISFDEVKQCALKQWGPPDLDVGNLYSEAEVSGLSCDRVHYFLISLAEK